MGSAGGHDYRPDHSGWGRSFCRRCGMRWQPRMADFWDTTWLISRDDGKTWQEDKGPPVPPCEPPEIKKKSREETHSGASR